MHETESPNGQLLSTFFSYNVKDDLTVKMLLEIFPAYNDVVTKTGTTLRIEFLSLRELLQNVQVGTGWHMEHLPRNDAPTTLQLNEEMRDILSVWWVNATHREVWLKSSNCTKQSLESFNVFPTGQNDMIRHPKSKKVLVRKRRKAGYWQLERIFIAFQKKFTGRLQCSRPAEFFKTVYLYRILGVCRNVLCYQHDQRKKWGQFCRWRNTWKLYYTLIK